MRRKVAPCSGVYLEEAQHLHQHHIPQDPPGRSSNDTVRSLALEITRFLSSQLCVCACLLICLRLHLRSSAETPVSKRRIYLLQFSTVESGIFPFRLSLIDVSV
jgi:hypothetical protein